MKKLFATILVAALAGGTAHAGSVAFDFGTNFFKPSATGGQVGNGSNFLVSWTIDNDISFGAYTESSIATATDSNAVPALRTGTLTVTAIQVTKGIVKNVAVGLNLGSGTLGAAWTAETDPLVDILGTLNILSGKGDKVEGYLKAIAAARFCNTGGGANNVPMDGINFGLAVGASF